MPLIIDISTAVPKYKINRNDSVKFYDNAIQSLGNESQLRKLKLLADKTKIDYRYSSIPDFNGNNKTLYQTTYTPNTDEIMKIYKTEIIDLASKAVDKLINQTGIDLNTITHLITVSCTGVFAPGLEFLLSDKYHLEKTEKIAINFLGCYAAIKALKQAYYIASSNSSANVLIVCAELCSIHFTPSLSDEDIVSNLIFGDGASALIVSGNESELILGRTAFKIEAIGSKYLPQSLDLMTWNISDHAFKMFLSKQITNSIKDSIADVVSEFLHQKRDEITYWAIHPGGIKIVEAVKESLELKEEDVQYSLEILKDYGNMSSPTILFILQKILFDIRLNPNQEPDNIFACAFGPGLSIEMIRFSTSLN